MPFSSEGAVPNKAMTVPVTGIRESAELLRSLQNDSLDRQQIDCDTNNAFSQKD